MTVQEFSDQFDILVDSYRRFKDFDSKEILDSIEFNEYEKSVYLTKAQEEIIKDLYSGRYTGDSFESSEQLRRELDYLVTQKDYNNSDIINEDLQKLTDSKYTHTVFSLPQDCLYIVYEQVSWNSDNPCIGGKVADVIPVTHDEYIRIRNNPFRGPNTRKALRLDNGASNVELVSSDDIGSYIIRYIKVPEPIVLSELPNETINGISTPQTCKLNESLHRDILDRAVRLALSKKLTNTKDTEKS